MKKNGFVFVETIVVVVIVLTSLLTVYSLFITSNNTTSRRMRYDDVARIYEAYYIEKYLNSFNLSALKERIDNGSEYEIIYRGRPDLFMGFVDQENEFFERLWEELHIINIYLLPSNVSDIILCSNNVKAVCSDRYLVNYLKTLDVYTEKYLLLIEFATKDDGSACENTADCYYSFVHIKAD